MKPILVPRKKRSRSVSGTSSSNSADVIANNDDLLTLILFLLPIKSLLKFKSVSKHWLSLISNPRFADLRRIHNPSSSTSGFFLRTSSPYRINPEFDFISLEDENWRGLPPFKPLTFIHDRFGIQILQSCNGLLCCSTNSNRESKRNYYIYNPTTKQCTTLPKIRPAAHRVVFGMFLAFDPSKSSHYKVVCVRNSDLELDDRYQIEIYSSVLGPWRISGQPFTAHANTNFKDGVFWNGAVHWISTWRASNSLYFHVEQERIREMPMPESPSEWDWRRVSYFGASRDHLHLVESYGPHTTQFNVYEMEKDYSRWFVKYRVDINPVAIAIFPQMKQVWLDPLNVHYCAFSILCLVRGETEEESFLVLHLPGNAISYNLKDKTYKKLCDFAPDGDNDGDGDDHMGTDTLRFDRSDAYQYIQSLSCV